MPKYNDRQVGRGLYRVCGRGHWSWLVRIFEDRNGARYFLCAKCRRNRHASKFMTA